MRGGCSPLYVQGRSLPDTGRSSLRDQVDDTELVKERLPECRPIHASNLGTDVGKIQAEKNQDGKSRQGLADEP